MDEHARLLLDQSPDAIIFAATDSAVTYWNAAAERIFGFDAATMASQGLDAIIPEQFRDAHATGFARALAAGDTKYRGQALATRATRADGETIYVELSFAIVNRAFTPRTVASRKPGIEARIAHLLDQAPAGPLEVMSALAEPLAPSTILAHLGIPDDEQSTFRDLSLQIMRARAEGPRNSTVVEAADEAVDALIDLLQEWDESGRCEPTSVVGTLFAAAHNGEDLDPEDLLMLLIHISTAGNGATAMAIGNIAYHLATTPDQRDELLNDRSLIPAAVEELLRFDSPTHLIARFAVQDATVGGRKIRAGEQLYVCVGAANRDPSEFENPDSLDFHREENRHLSFGFGGHFCLGAPLARLEFQSAIEALLDRYGKFELKAFQRGGTLLVRGPRRVVIG